MSRAAGFQAEIWIAEAEVLSERTRSARSAILVDVDGVQYVGEYDRDACEGYSPGEFASGDEIRVRFEGEKMFVRRANGQELETQIVQKIGGDSFLGVPLSPLG